MPRQSKNKFDVINNEIHITREGWSLIGITTYREDYFIELTSYNTAKGQAFDVDSKIMEHHIAAEVGK